MRPHRHIRKRPIAEINVVPYIDVMLVLLIIFMVTAPLLQHGIDVDLPQAAAVPSNADSSEPLIISIGKDGKIYSDAGDDPERPISLERLKVIVAALDKRRKDLQVYINGDRGADYGNVVAVFVALQSIGKDKVFLMTEPLDN
jgi:biopolymer transport protein TolR